jgi:kynurenine 3-monooxygenase
MNCGFEDCRILDELIEKNGDDWGTILQQYQGLRKPDAEGLHQELARLKRSNRMA